MEQFVSKNGINYMCIGTNFTDARNVYLEGGTERIGTIVFVDRKPVYNGYRHEVSRYTKGFVFEPESKVEIKCTDFKNIAKYVYQLNDLFKNYKNQENNSKGSD